MNLALFLTVAGVVTVVGQDKPIPVISEDFQCNTLETDGNNVTVVKQFLAFDATMRRSNMEAVGSLVHGAMQQIKHCDYLPKEGWMTTAGGPNPTDPSSWTCTNTTISQASEIPQNCQYGNFWSFPDNVKYMGYDDLNGVECERWEYLVEDDTYAFWAISEGNIPVASGKIYSPNPESSLWTIYFTNFEAGHPVEESFQSIEGVDCPPSSDPSVYRNESKIIGELGMRDSLNNLSELLHLLEARVEAMKTASIGDKVGAGEEIKVCKAASESDSTDWGWQFQVGGTSYSCSSSNGGTNDLGTHPAMCEGDPTSVRMEVTPGLAECLVASSSECKIDMHDFVSLDYEFTVDSCMGIWAAPLWLTPDTWQWGPGSGEIDSLEFCPRSAMSENFAGGGHQLALDNSTFSIDGSTGHVTVRKDEEGIVTVRTCTKEEAVLNPYNQCNPPVYADCDDCLWGQNNQDFACWCNADSKNIYGSGGCTEGTDCLWFLVSDIWNGVSGDDGYSGCMTEVPDINLPSGQPNLNSECAFSVEKIVLRGGGPDGRLLWAEGSPTYCDVFTV